MPRTEKNTAPSRLPEIQTSDDTRLSTWALSSLDYLADARSPTLVVRLVPFPLAQPPLLRSLHVAQAWVCCLSVALALEALASRATHTHTRALAHVHAPFLSRSLARADGLSAPSLCVLFAPRDTASTATVIVGDRSGGADGRARCIY